MERHQIVEPQLLQLHLPGKSLLDEAGVGCCWANVARSATAGQRPWHGTVLLQMSIWGFPNVDIPVLGWKKFSING